MIPIIRPEQQEPDLEEPEGRRSAQQHMTAAARSPLGSDEEGYHLAAGQAEAQIELAAMVRRLVKALEL